MKINSKYKSYNKFFNKKIYKLHLGKVFLICFILTIFPFLLACERDEINKKIITIAIISCITMQIIIQFVYFLHLKLPSTNIQQWNLISCFFTILIIIILVSGSIWIMHHLHHNLM
ncbi:Cytochrome bo(3) ubiquinol oxidase subunit 4 [Candidatus Westeberhardia cardiocondylae]|uniref:Cytochrome bo(3) ubiquinol oxidase subunit 4 n=1 Tax=Candidatus Westeberhardia cardiocondylae TaxID=1594731 RepID=A0A0H5C5B4_9ENTR|nr:cytochrome o ubiquinol oxidase subunit IV [Candidatus Westeberhardia cardiocondylae]CEN32126.1 Cytochrome bo(3) ubiquinol oxidase subunit 4 [Candidatus Westeberhardia cardiocondylae]